MQDYSKLIQALRCKRDDCEGCDLAFLDNDEGWMCQYAAKDDDAADAIEALQAEVKKAAKRNAELHAELEKWVSAAEQAGEPKRGEWSEENRRPRSMQFVCSVCHRTAYDPQPSRDKAWRKRCRYLYCPNCGAKMEVQE